MLNCESFEVLLADVLYSDDAVESSIAEPSIAELPAEAQQHLHSCQTCEALYEELKNAKLGLDELGLERELYADIPERASLADLYDKLSPRLDQIDAQRFRELPRRGIAPWSAAIGAIAASFLIFITAFVITQSDPETAPAPMIVNAPSPDLMNYLNRAELMLMQVANAESTNGSVLPVGQTFARDMALEASLLTGADNSPFDSGERKLLKDIEFLLRQIANLDEANMNVGVPLLQRFLEENGILFKIRLMELSDQELVI